MTDPIFGALPDERGVTFRVMSAATPPKLVVHTGRAAGSYELQPAGDGLCAASVAGASPGDRYSYRLEDGALRPDPASRFQPDGVHGPSEVVDPARYTWRDTGWKGRSAAELVIYELHVGTFTPEGTFDAARRRLPELRSLGVTAIELMPVADFAGARNWGYDGVALFAPSRAYGRPDDLRAFVDAAHALGLAVIVDVVYNHLGPEGAYVTQFYPSYVTSRHRTPWGGAINLDGCGSGVVRRFIIDNAVHWLREYHLDGLRVDATHALADDSPAPLMQELAQHARRAVPWPVALHAEDHRNLAALVQSADDGGWGFDGIWADDFHHSIRRLLAGDSHSYYRDFEGTAEELARTIRQGWLYTGQHSTHMKRNRGTDPSPVPMRASIVCLQNHDQVGNRARGDRLHHHIDAAAWRAASTLLLTAPMTPLLFMGQEWGAGTPFLYFTDLEPGLGRAVTEGRRREFAGAPGFDSSQDVPDPQAEHTFRSSTLRWEERDRQPHAGHLGLYARLLALRAAEPALQASERLCGDAWAPGPGAVVMRRAHEETTFLIVASLAAAGEIQYSSCVDGRRRFEAVLTTEDLAFAADPQAPRLSPGSITFQRAGAAVLREVHG
jgi:maltooligosyltrehalose trehalohydrolase